MIKLIKFNEIEKNFKHPKTFLYIFAPWCGECKMNHSLVEKIAKNHPEINFIQMNVDEEKLWESDNIHNLKILKVPTFLGYLGEKEVFRETNFKNLNELELLIRRLD